MKHTRLGRSGLYVSRLALGTMTFGGAGTPQWDRIGALDVSAADRILSAALARGVNLVDTADIYADGDSERILGELLHGRRDQVVLASKVGTRVGPGPNDVGSSRLHILSGVEASLRRLRTDHIDLLQLHAFDPPTPLEETLSALDDLVRQGKIRYAGVSNFSAWQLVKAAGIATAHDLAPLVSTQSYYSLAGRDLESEVIPALSDLGLGLLVYSPLAGGFLSGKFDRSGTQEQSARRVTGSQPPVEPELVYNIVDVLRPIATRHNASVAQVALAWVLAQPSVTSVIVGARREQQLHDNLAAIDLDLTDDDLADLDQVSRPRETYPGWAHRAVLAAREPVQQS